MVSFIYIQRDRFLNYTWDQIHAVVAYFYNYDDYVNYISITGKEKVCFIVFYTFSLRQWNIWTKLF